MRGTLGREHYFRGGGGSNPGIREREGLEACANPYGTVEKETSARPKIQYCG